jgi:hypothetical protein
MGGAIGALMASHAHGSVSQVVAIAIGGGSSLSTHLVKTGVRMGVNASPEPFSNTIASLLEDLSASGIVVFALLHRLAAEIIAGALLLIGVVSVALLASRIRRFLRRRGRVSARTLARSP